MILFLLGILGPNLPSLLNLKTLSLRKTSVRFNPKIFLLYLGEYICILFIVINRMTNIEKRFIGCYLKTPLQYAVKCPKSSRKI
jgi:hypothetical protein